MKVLLISHACRSRTAGQQKAQLLATQCGVRLQLVVPELWNDSWNHEGLWQTPDVPIDPAFTFTPLKVRWPWLGPAQSYLHWYPKLRGVLEEFKPDVIDVWEEPWGLVSAHVCWLRDRIVPNAKIICETEQNLFKRLPPPFEVLRQYVQRRVDLMVGRSSQAIDVLRRKGYAGPAEVVPNAVDTEIFRPMDREKCREQMGVGGFVVGYVGRLVEQKGLADLLQAVAKCHATINLLIVGSGPYETEVRRLVDVLNVVSRVRMVPEVARNDLPPIINAMDVLAVPSRTTARWKEQFGRVIIEAHACGVPVIGSDSGAIPLVIGDGGLVVPEQNVALLAAGLERLMADESGRRSMAKAGLLATTEQYTWAAVAQHMRILYDRVLALPKNHAAGEVYSSSEMVAS